MRDTDIQPNEKYTSQLILYQHSHFQHFHRHNYIIVIILIGLNIQQSGSHDHPPHSTHTPHTLLITVMWCDLIFLLFPFFILTLCLPFSPFNYSFFSRLKPSGWGLASRWMAWYKTFFHYAFLSTLKNENANNGWHGMARGESRCDVMLFSRE